MFTIADIRNIAVQIELNGEKTYREASKNAKDPAIAKALARLADDERSHAEWFESITSDKPLSERQQEMEVMGRAILQDMVKNQTFSLEQSELQKSETLEELYRQSQTFEQDTILFYQMLSGFIEDVETMAQLEAIIAEERCHLQALRALAKRISV